MTTSAVVDGSLANGFYLKAEKGEQSPTLSTLYEKTALRPSSAQTSDMAAVRYQYGPPMRMLRELPLW